MSGELISLVTCPEGQAAQIANRLVQEKLCACVNIVSHVQSIYKWNGIVNNDRESLLIAKLHERVWEAFRQRVKELHPYEVPEIICLRIEDGFQAYLDWISDSVK